MSRPQEDFSQPQSKVPNLPDQELHEPLNTAQLQAPTFPSKLFQRTQSRFNFFQRASRPGQGNGHGFQQRLQNRLQKRLQRHILLRRLFLVAFDGLLIATAVVAAFALRLQQRQTLLQALHDHMMLVPLAVLCGLPILLLSGWYRGLTRYAGSHSLYGLLPRAGLVVLALLLVNTMTGSPDPPRSFWILYWLLLTGAAIASRIMMRDLLLRHLDQASALPLDAEPSQAGTASQTLIYGAGSTGRQLLESLRSSPNFECIGFLDDDRSVHGRTLQNLPIWSPEDLPKLIQRHSLDQVLLALPSISRSRKRQLVDQLTHLGLRVLSIPSLSQLVSGRQVVTDLQPVAIEDLLGREPSTPDPQLLSASVCRKAVLVTGAGGSIGSELCRQIVALGASRLVMLERHEFALYSIERELAGLSGDDGTTLLPVIGDASDSGHLISLCSRHGIETIFHAAAYKHVPMVEANLCAGVANNLRGTRAVIEAARRCRVERVTLISTDKAVRPTNAMGASKRVCELLFQAAAAESETRRNPDSPHQPSQPIFAMVRFGNVLGSSGSVIPLFHQQIARGGPVTVTHPAITRYFMTIPEAVQLVLQATGMARGGDLFLLDMGEPVRIADLARQMIELSGLRIRDATHPDGDIAIRYTGLRPGEKLYEELLISPGDHPTDHPLIRRASEPGHAWDQLEPLLNSLEKALACWDDGRVAQILQELVPEYTHESTRTRRSTPALP